MSKKSGKGVYILAFALLLGGLGYLIVSGISQGSTPTLTVNEALKMDDSNLSKVRLYGDVQEQDLQIGEKGLDVTFALADKMNPEGVVMIKYSGVIPDTFTAGAEVIVKGTMDEGVFKATTLTTKCPSKYEEGREG